MKREACGIFGAVSDNENKTPFMIYNGLLSVQHRGQEACGIAISDKNDIKLKRFLGLVTEAIPRNTLADFKGNIGIGHVRYSTVGKTRIIDSQPMMIDYPRHGIAIAQNGNTVNYVDLTKEVKDKGRRLNSTSDAELILYILAEELAATKDIEDAVLGVMERVEGAFSIIGLTGKNELIAFRDPHGFRPLCYGSGEGKRLFASESVALQVNNAEFKGDVKPGELLITNKEGKIQKKTVLPCKKCKHCMFEYVYISRPDSVVDEKSVYDVRVNLGKNLAKTYSSDADIVVPVPDTGRPAAEGISRETGIPVAEGLIKNRYIGRTFIMPSQEMRDNAVNVKMNPNKRLLKDKHVILVDDSIVRGTTSRKIINLMKNAGAKKIDFFVTCPPIISPCFYGIDFATHGELIAASNTIPEIKKTINTDDLCYQTIDGLVNAIGIKKSNLCMACLTGEYPTHMAQTIADKMKNQTSLKKTRYFEMEGVC